MEKLKLELVFQVGVCVSDADTVLENWKNYFDIDESAIVSRNLKELHDQGGYTCGNYLGHPCEYYHKLYRFDLGGIDFEIIEPITKQAGNPYTDFLSENGGNGIHHLGVVFKDRERLIKTMDEWGVPLYTYSSQGPTAAGGALKDCYFYDLRDKLGVILEAASHAVGPRACEHTGPL